ARRSALLIRRTELQERIRFVEKSLAEGKEAEVMMVVARTSDKPSGAEKSLDEQLLPLLLPEQQLLESYGDDHPQVKSVRSRIALIRETFAKAGLTSVERGGAANVQRHLQALREELHEADMVLASLAKVLDGLKTQAKDLSSYLIQEEHLRNEIALTH